MNDDLIIDIKATADTTQAEAQVKSFINKYDKSTVNIEVKTESSSKKDNKEQDFMAEQMAKVSKSMHELNAQELAYSQTIQKSTKALNALNKAKQAYQNLNSGEIKGQQELIKHVKLYNDAAAYALKAIGDVKASEDIINRGVGRQSSSAKDEKYLNAQLNIAYNNRQKLIALEDQYGDKINESAVALERLASVQAAYNNLSDTSGSMQEQIQAVREYNDAAKETINMIKGFAEVDPDKLLKAQSSFQAYLSKNSKYLTDPTMVQEANRIMETYAQNTVASFNAANSGAALFKVRLEELGLTGRTAFDTMSEKLKKFTSWFTISQAVMAAVRLFKNMVVSVKELDASLVELAKVSDLSSSSLQKFTNDAFAMGASLARTGKEVIDATTTFKRAGYDLNDSFQLAEQALLLTNVGDGIGNVETAASSLIAILRGFDQDISYADHIVDMINEVSNTAPIDASNITDGLTRTAALLHQSGTSIEETIGLITGGFAQLRNVEWVTTGLNMISQRLRGMEEDGTKVTGLASKIEGEFQRLAGINIMEGGDLRSTYEIIADMAEIFPQMIKDGKGAQVQYLTELAAGNRQARNLTAIINGWEDVEKAVESAMDAEGSALKENARYMDSIQGRLANFQSAFQKLSQSTIDSDMFKGAVTSATKFLELITKIIDTIGALPVVLGAVTGGASLFGKDIGKFNDKDFLLGGNFSMIDGIKNAFSQNGDSIEKAALAIDIYNAKLAEGVVGEQALAAARDANSASADKYLSKLASGTVANAKASMDGYNASLQLTSGALVKAKLATIAMNVATNMLVSAVVSLGIALVSKLINAQQDIIDKAYEMRTTFQETMGAIDGNITTIESLESEFKRLSTGVGQYGENISLGTDEYRRYQEIVSQIVEISPSLIAGYTNEGNAIINKNTAIQESIRLLEEERRLTLENYYSQDEMWTNLSGSIEEYRRQHWEYVEAVHRVTDIFGDRDFTDKKMNFVADVLGLEPQTNTTQFLADNSNAILNGIDQLIARANDKSSKYYGILSDKDLERLTENKDIYLKELASLQSAAESFDIEMVGLTQMAKGYEKLDEMNKNLAAQFASSFNIKDYMDDMNFSNMDKFINAYNDVLSFTEELANNDALQEAVTKFFEIDTSQLTMDEWEKEAVKLYNNIVSSFGDDATEPFKMQLRIALGLSVVSADNPNKEIKRKEELYNNVREKFGLDHLSDNILNKFTREEIDIILSPNFEVDNVVGKLGQMETKIREELERARAAQIDVNVSYIYDETLAKVQLLDQAIKEQASNGRLTDATYRNMYNQGEEYQLLLSKTAGIFALNNEEAEKYRQTVIETGKEQALMAGATKEQREEYDKLMVVTGEAATAFDVFSSSMENANKAESLFDTAASAVKVLQDGLEKGYTDTEVFHDALRALFGDNMPADLSKALEDLGIIFGTDEESIDDMIKKFKELTNSSKVDLLGLQEALHLTDEAMDAVIQRLDEAGLLFARGDPSVYKLGNGLGMAADKAVEFEGKAAGLFTEFNKGRVSIDEARSQFAKLLDEFGLTGLAADTALANWERLIGGLNIDTIGAFKGLDAPTQEKARDLANKFLEHFNAQFAEKANDGELSELRIDLNVEAYKKALEKELLELGEHSKSEIARIVEEMGNEYYEVQIETFIKNSLADVEMTDDVRQEVIASVREAIGEDGRVDYSVLVDIMISTNNMEIEPEAAAKVRELVENYLKGEITIDDLRVELGKLDIGDLATTLPAALEAAEKLNGAFEGADSSLKGLRDEASKYTKQAREAKTITEKLAAIRFGALTGSMSGTATALDKIRIAAQKAWDIMRKLAGNTPTNSPTIPTGGRSPEYAEGGISPRRENAIVGDEFNGAYEMVLSKDGTRKVYGENGAELITLNEGDIVFPHDVTKKILSGQIRMLPDGLWPSSNYSSTSSGGSKSKNKSSSTSDAVKEQIEAIFDDLRHQLEMDMITEAQYYKKLEEYNNKYYKGKSDMLKEYRSNLEEIYKWQKQQEEERIELEFTTLKHQLEMGKITEGKYIRELDKLNNKYYKGKEDKLSEYRSNLEEVYKWQVEQEEDLVESFFTLLKFRLNMEQITEAEYYKELEKLNNTYYKGKEDKLDDYRSNLEELYKWQKQQEEEAIQAQFDDNSHRLNMNYITQEQYYQKLRELNDKYYKHNEEKLKEYRSNLETLYNWEKEQLRNSINAQISLTELLRSMMNIGSPNYVQYTDQLYELQRQMQEQIQKEIAHYRLIGYREDSDILQKLKQEWYDIERWKREEIKKTKELEIEHQESAINAVVRRLNKQIEDLKKKREDLADEDIEGSYGYRIKAIRDEIESLKERNDEVNKELELQKERDNLERLRKQRNLLIYREGIGFVYEVDVDAIKDAEDRVKDLELDLYINKLEKEQKALEEQLEAEQKAIDKAIKGWEEYRDKWQDLTNEYKESQEELMAIQEIGADWEAQILAQRLDTFEKFRQAYLEKLKSLNEEIVNNPIPDTSTKPPLVTDTGKPIPQTENELPDINVIITQPLENNNSGGGYTNVIANDELTYSPGGGNAALNKLKSSTSLVSRGNDTVLEVKSVIYDGEAIGEIMQVENKSIDFMSDISSNVEEISNTQRSLAKELTNSILESIDLMDTGGLSFSTGDIIIQETNNSNDLAKQIVSSLPNQVAQAIYKKTV